jgi:hypothetical protein
MDSLPILASVVEQKRGGQVDRPCVLSFLLTNFMTMAGVCVGIR